METDAVCTCARDTARGREGKRSFRNESYLRDSMEEGPRKGGGGRPSSRYIDRRLRSAIPHFKGKISVYSGRLLPRNYSEELASRIAAQMENNVTFCSWQVSREPGEAFASLSLSLFFASFVSLISAGNFGVS